MCLFFDILPSSFLVAVYNRRLLRHFSSPFLIGFRRQCSLPYPAPVSLCHLQSIFLITVSCGGFFCPPAIVISRCHFSSPFCFSISCRHSLSTILPGHFSTPIFVPISRHQFSLPFLVALSRCLFQSPNIVTNYRLHFRSRFPSRFLIEMFCPHFSSAISQFFWSPVPRCHFSSSFLVVKPHRLLLCCFSSLLLVAICPCHFPSPFIVAISHRHFLLPFIYCHSLIQCPVTISCCNSFITIPRRKFPSPFPFAISLSSFFHRHLLLQFPVAISRLYFILALSFLHFLFASSSFLLRSLSHDLQP